MAGGKQSPRQKMINLMYLVFIAMMAMNMSKEVLSAFGLINDNLTESNAQATERNKNFLAGLKEKAGENAKQYGELAEKAAKIDALANDFTAYVESIKSDVLSGVKDPKDYETMDKAKLDEVFFAGGDKYSPKGQEFVDKMNAFRTGVIALLGNDYKEIQSEINTKFSTEDVKTRDNIKKSWLDYHYKGFPLVASITKLTKIQSDVKTVQSEILSAMLQGNLASQVSMTNYKAIVVLDKNAFYQGEQVTGKVVLGRYDENTVPTAINGLSGAKIENGQAVFAFGAGAVGEHDIKGQFVFQENGENVPIEIDGKYVVIPRPNEATISADKMNSIYRGVDNPMSISFAGVSDNKVQVSAPGLSKVGPGKYNWRPDQIQGNEATVSVTATMEDGKKVSSTKTFKVRHIPAPAASIRGQVGTMRGNKEDLINSSVGVSFGDFVFDVSANVQSFEVSVPGQARIVCQGNRLSAQAQAAIRNAKRGDIVVIGNVKSVLSGGLRVKDSTPFAWEIN